MGENNDLPIPVRRPNTEHQQGVWDVQAALDSMRHDTLTVEADIVSRDIFDQELRSVADRYVIVIPNKNF